MAPTPTVDVIIENGDEIVLVRRKRNPFKKMLALPGGFLDNDERVEQAAIREAEEETSLIVRLKEILGVYSDPKRDPRKHTVTTVFIAEPVQGQLEAGRDVMEAKWFTLEKLNPDELAFDHAKILTDYALWKKTKRTFWSSLEVSK